MSPMRLLAACVFALAFAACGRAPAKAPAAENAAAPAAGQAPLVELKPSDVRAPFERATVVKLNAIVRQSLTAIREYDGMIDGVRAAVAEAAAPDAPAAARQRAEQGVGAVAALHARAVAAQAELQRAVADLKASGETYNAEILAGMVAFVDKVENETGAEETALRARLGG